ncbi:Hypothetical_protein [Hexamita inflata]|uniref:Hypothetical_protein n=1 Tax=Hexamita inflata TaxID=28002 RepID=A0AA86P4Q0_9EUKA|nr:Hypothetical protein HINF_LOCUS19564 [Hexamita inflata]
MHRFAPNNSLLRPNTTMPCLAAFCSWFFCLSFKNIQEPKLYEQSASLNQPLETARSAGAGRQVMFVVIAGYFPARKPEISQYLQTPSKTGKCQALQLNLEKIILILMYFQITLYLLKLYQPILRLFRIQFIVFQLKNNNK